MTDQQTLTPVDVQAIAAGGAAIRAWLDAEAPYRARVIFNTDCDAMAEAALDAAGKVYAADDEAFVQDQLANTRLLGMDISDGAVNLRVMPALETAAAMVMTAKTILDGNPGAQNYVEHSVIDRETGDRYVLTVHKPAGKTPHELRQEAEAQRDALADDLARIAMLAESVRAATGALPSDREDTLEQIERLASQASAAVGGKP